jgi:hypothetical protein
LGLSSAIGTPSLLGRNRSLTDSRESHREGSYTTDQAFHRGVLVTEDNADIPVPSAGSYFDWATGDELIDATFCRSDEIEMYRITASGVGPNWQRRVQEGKIGAF